MALLLSALLMALLLMALLLTALLLTALLLTALLDVLTRACGTLYHARFIKKTNCVLNASKCLLSGCLNVCAAHVHVASVPCTTTMATTKRCFPVPA